MNKRLTNSSTPFLFCLFEYGSCSINCLWDSSLKNKHQQIETMKILRQQILKIFFAIMVALSPMLVRAYDFEYEGLYYNIVSSTDFTAEVAQTFIKEYQGDIIIPTTVVYKADTYTVVSIEENAFFCDNITSVVIPNSVTQMGYCVFGGCENLVSVTLPEGITVIEDCMFEDCLSLTSITIPAGVKTIGEGAFSGSGLTSITIPNSVETIESGAFSNCQKCKEITIPADNPYFTSIDGVLFSKDKKKLIQYPAGKVGNSYIVPAGVTHIGNDAFKYSHLSNIKLPDGVEEIGSDAFLRCEKLTGITLPNSVKEIGWGSFMSCLELTAINIPNKIKKIPGEAFANCNCLETIIIPSSVTEIGDWAFCDAGLTSVTIPQNVTNIHYQAFGECSDLSSVTLSCRNTIGSSSFTNCSNLTTVTFTEDVEVIVDSKLFSGCDNIRIVSVGATLPPIIEDGTFSETVESRARLKVRPDCKSAFESSLYWSDFTNIVEDVSAQTVSIHSEPVQVYAQNGNIEIVGAENEAVTVYNADGREVYRGYGRSIPVSAKGLYIVKITTSSYKVVL